MNAPDQATGQAHASAPPGLGSRRAAPLPVAVLGGGPIGMVCALLLARAGIACELVDARPIEALQRDRRLLALARGTLSVLERALGSRPADRLPLAPIERVLVSSQGDLGAVELGARDFGGLAVGATAWYADLCGALMGAIERLAAGPGLDARLRVQRPRRARALVQRHDRVEIELDDGSVLQASIAVNAEGTPPTHKTPRFTALLAPVVLAGPRPGDAIERFTGAGPLALLPMPGAPGGDPGGKSARAMSMIWCLPSPQAGAALEIPEGELVGRIGRALGPRVGIPVSVGERGVFPLATHLLERICEHRVVHLGNAAQSLHPVAGQGFNLGIRDCACLVDCIAQRTDASSGFAATARRVAPDPLEALRDYQRRRWLDRQIVPRLTGALPKVFGSPLAPVAALRSGALLALDALGPARRAFTRLLMYGS